MNISKAAAIMGSKGGKHSSHHPCRNRDHCIKMVSHRWGDQLSRFLSKVDKGSGPTQCWNWKGWKNDFGYGVLRFDGIEQRAHRVSWQIYNGKIAKDRCVLHRCDNPSCCNPAHLFQGTKHDNTQDMIIKGRHKFVAHPGESNGSAKISKADVIKIRSDYARGIKTQTEIASEYGITQSCVWRIIMGLIWKHV